MNNWKELPKNELQYEIVKCMESLRPAFYQLITMADQNIRPFDYYVDTCVDHDIILLDDGHEFAIAKTDNFNNAGDLMMWVMQALNEYYYDYCEPDDPIFVDYTSIKNKREEKDED